MNLHYDKHNTIFCMVILDMVLKKATTSAQWVFGEGVQFKGRQKKQQVFPHLQPLSTWLLWSHWIDPQYTVGYWVLKILCIEKVDQLPIWRNLNKFTMPCICVIISSTYLPSSGGIFLLHVFVSWILKYRFQMPP